MTGKARADAGGIPFDVLDANRVGKLGMLGSNKHIHPMNHFAGPDAGEMRFIIPKNTDQVRHIGIGAQAHCCVMTAEGDFHACFAAALGVASMVVTLLLRFAMPQSVGWLPGVFRVST